MAYCYGSITAVTMFSRMRKKSISSGRQKLRVWNRNVDDLKSQKLRCIWQHKTCWGPIWFRNSNLPIHSPQENESVIHASMPAAFWLDSLLPAGAAVWGAGSSQQWNVLLALVHVVIDLHCHDCQQAKVRIQPEINWMGKLGKTLWWKEQENGVLV